MPSATTPRKAPERPSSPSPARERLLAAAGRVFYAEGIHATPVDRVIEEAGVTRATFYRHFPGKESLVLAYVERRDAEVRATAAEAAETIATPLDLLHALVAGVAAEICRPGFRGCLFLNAAAEYPDPGNPVRVAVAGHRAWLRELLADLLSRAGRPGPARRRGAAPHAPRRRDGRRLPGVPGIGTGPADRGGVHADPSGPPGRPGRGRTVLIADSRHGGRRARG
ncbi:hypothetical protein SLAVM298S_07597 [Streptomyces lavendulae subsp. lavendulae]